MYRKVIVFSGTSTISLAKQVCRNLSVEPGRVELGRFNDGEVRVQLLENVRDADVFILGALTPPAENILEMLFLTDAARRSSAGRITLVPTYLGYNRQDRKDKPRVPMSSRVIIDMLSASGANHVLLFDLHSEVTVGFFDRNVVVDHLYASLESVPYLKSILKRPFVVGAPDKGGGPRARAYAELLNLGDFIIFDKIRAEAGRVQKVKIIGNVRGRNVLLVDDMIDTGGTMIADAEAAMEKGARAVYAYATHLIASGDAIARLDQSPIKELVVTDSIPQRPGTLKTKRLKITVIPLPGIIAGAIRRIHDGDSLSELFLSAK